MPAGGFSSAWPAAVAARACKRSTLQAQVHSEFAMPHPADGCRLLWPHLAGCGT